MGKYATVEFRENCAGSCRDCVKKKCVYGVFQNNYLHMSTMTEPEYLYTCNGCLRCVQECTKAIFSLVINPEYQSLGDEYWTPDILYRTWYQAHTGKIPVTGAGYRGPFVGKGFDSMWTDMSEIVRPTRDGIHGREYINTCIELSRKPPGLSFNPDMSLATEVPPILELPLPMVFHEPDFGVSGENTRLALAGAAGEIGTLLFIDAGHITGRLKPYIKSLAPCITTENHKDFTELISECRMVEITFGPGVEDVISKLRSRWDHLFISVGIPLMPTAAETVTGIAGLDVDTVHFYADNHGLERGTDNPLHLRDAIRKIHLALVENSERQKINLLFSGGIAMAEHVAKSIICGADGAGVDVSLLVAMECRMCFRCKQGLSCPAELETICPEYGAARIVNLVGAWRNQILEMMGAMGLREARRLRGEAGRAMWFEDLEKECFGPIFGERKV